MGKINLLDIEISNKIAAGEVVERPASVVKELVENSIDAGAKKITVEIKNGGNTYIKVTDDGCGMEKDDAAVAFLRHATSKIKTEEDLDAIYTLGFRGEALSSIGAVAMVDLYTKRKEDEFGVHTVCQGGEIVSSDDAGIPNGTSFIVKNLFYNVPARMKFLKKDATEAGYITDIMTRFILAHPEISFKLISNGKEVLFSSGDGNLKNSVYSVYGKDYATSMLEVDFKTEYIKVKGLTGKGTTARPNRNQQSFFVNGRYIKSPLIMRAVEEAYKNQIMIGKFPTAVLNIEINPSLIDINVHPTKLEVKFSNESEVYSAVYHGVKDALYRIADIPQIKAKEEVKSEFTRDKIIPNSQVIIEKVIPPEPLKKEETVKSVETIYDKKINIVKEPIMFAKTDNLKNQEEIKISPKPVFAETKKEETQNVVLEIQQNSFDVLEETKEPQNIIENKIGLSKPQVPEFKLVGQVFDTYIIIECDDEMRIIDQHAAHERLKYEELLLEMKEKRAYTQSLLIPEVLDLTSNEMATFLQNIEFINSLGFEAEEFGNNSVVIRSVPNSAVSDDIGDLFIEIISQLENLKKEIITKKQERLLYTIACKSAIKANHKLDEREQKELVKRVYELENINTCPHGRPIVISMSKKEVEKQFKRIL